LRQKRHQLFLKIEIVQSEAIGWRATIARSAEASDRWVEIDLDILPDNRRKQYRPLLIHFLRISRAAVPVKILLIDPALLVDNGRQENPFDALL
jgi:hypothetical protein